MNITTSRNVGMNKGTPRIWLEGCKLEQAGFKYHARYTVDVKRVQIILTLKEDGEKAVSGKRSKAKSAPEGYFDPVIDLHNSGLSDFLQGDTVVSVTYQKGVITIRRNGN